MTHNSSLSKVSRDHMHVATCIHDLPDELLLQVYIYASEAQRRQLLGKETDLRSGDQRNFGLVDKRFQRISLSDLNWKSLRVNATNLTALLHEISLGDGSCGRISLENSDIIKAKLQHLTRGRDTILISSINSQTKLSHDEFKEATENFLDYLTEWKEDPSFWPELRDAVLFEIKEDCTRHTSADAIPGIRNCLSGLSKSSGVEVHLVSPYVCITEYNGTSPTSMYSSLDRPPYLQGGPARSIQWIASAHRTQLAKKTGSRQFFSLFAKDVTTAEPNTDFEICVAVGGLRGQERLRVSLIEAAKTIRASVVEKGYKFRCEIGASAAGGQIQVIEG